MHLNKTKLTLHLTKTKQLPLFCPDVLNLINYTSSDFYYSGPYSKSTQPTNIYEVSTIELLY